MDKSCLTLIDANFNRCKEGLRVVEDIFRFAVGNDKLRRQARSYRHNLVKFFQPALIEKAILKRNSIHDLGKKIDNFENKRKNLWDILYRNLQRTKESLRVLEEFSKIADKKNTSELKNLRYNIYDFEKEIIISWPSLCNTRQKNCRRVK